MADTLHTTPLHPLHLSLGARMVPFAGYDMPLQYTGIVAEHQHTRQQASLFDVSHMGQVMVHGDWPAVAAFLERHLPSDLQELLPGQMKYSLLLNDRGGIIDDLMVIRREKDVLLVVNAGRKMVDIAHLQAACPVGITLDYRPDLALLAFQGQAAASVVAENNPALATLPFMQGMQTTLHGISCYITRSGYTGEDGYEISVSGADSIALAQVLLASAAVRPAGLGARDTLRLEAGLCLYGHELTEDITPGQATLNWVIGKRRREAWGFAGDATVRQELEQGAPFARIGLVGNDRQPVREDTPLTLPDGQEAGVITSGSFSPVLGAPVAMARVRAAVAREPAFQAEVRGKALPLRRFALPFVKHRYYKG